MYVCLRAGMDYSSLSSDGAEAKKKQKVIDHMVSTLHSLLGTYPNAEIVLAGDRNELDLTQVRNKVPNLRLVSTGPTHKMKQLDVILTSLADCYKPAIVVDPIGADSDKARPSDHKLVILYPIDNLNVIKKAEGHPSPQNQHERYIFVPNQPLVTSS